MTALIALLLGAAVLLAVFLIWGLASRRHALPCPSWLGWMVEMDNPFTKTNRAQEIISHLGLKPGMAVLDAGCGPGRLTIPLAKALGGDGLVVALDVQDAMLERVRKKASAEKLDGAIGFLQAGLGEGKLPADAFDRALLVTVLGEIPGRAAALEEIFSALKPGGIVSITEVIFDPHFQTRGMVRRLAEAAGFRETAFFGNRIAYTIHFAKPDRVS
jgi:ubiquinone/menaquinone biosynthesis C-methylase UbiE